MSQSNNDDGGYSDLLQNLITGLEESIKGGKTVWYASSGDVLRAGPFESEAEAWESMKPIEKEQSFRYIRPKGTEVWPEYEKD